MSPDPSVFRNYDQDLDVGRITDIEEDIWKFRWQSDSEIWVKLHSVRISTLKIQCRLDGITGIRQRRSYEAQNTLMWTAVPACKRQYGTTERGTSTSTTQQDKLAEPLAGNKTASTQGGAEELGLLQLVNHQIDERIAAMEKTLTQTSLGS
ncbi:hypothetical protein Pelo_8802 [Pelomyxa schiedti]|nr:hypothetical protein Pelo_8802 [Pelomyxa schiedti]